MIRNKIKLLIFILIGLIVIAVGTLVTIKAVTGKLATLPLVGAYFDETIEKEHAKEFGPIMQAGDYTVNLKGDVTYLKVQISLEMVNKKAEEELKNLMPVIKDQVIDVIATKTVNDVSNPAGKEGLRKELQERLNQALGGTKVKTVLFTNYVYQ